MRQGSKAQKWKLIIRNVPFQVLETRIFFGYLYSFIINIQFSHGFSLKKLQAKPCDIKKIFSAVGFVWDVFIPKNSETGYVLTRQSNFLDLTMKKSMYVILI